jgi:serine/threonine protein kinase
VPEAAETRPLQPGDPSQLGTYELVGRLGEGGQGVVYLGRHGDAQVAIKLLRADLTQDPTARERFVREAMAATQVARFCTAQVLEADVAGDRPYIVSEYVPGPSLARLVSEEGPREGASLERLAVGTATALAAIHQAGIVHRDFKPHNVLISPDGPRVIDFGIARALDATSTVSTRSIGTPAYMAPEQVMGQTITPAVDMFAWASTMIFAATGQPAFGQDTIPAVASRIMTGEPDLSGIPDELAPLVRDCLAKDPSLRPQAKDVLMRLLGHPAPPAGSATEPATAVLAEGVTLAAAQTRTLGEATDETITPPPGRRRRTAVLAAISAVVLAGLIALVAVLLMNRDTGTPPAGPTAPVSSNVDTGGASQPAPAPVTTTSEPPTTRSEPPETPNSPPTATTTATEPPPPTSEAPPTSQEAPAPADS